METGNRLTASMENGGKKEEGSSQRTSVNDPWTWIMVWGWTVGVGGWGRTERGKGGNWENCNRINKKKYLHKGTVSLS